MKNKIRKVVKYCAENPYEIAFYAMGGVAVGALYALGREQQSHKICHSLARWTVAGVDSVPRGTKQNIWTDGKHIFIEAIKD